MTIKKETFELMETFQRPRWKHGIRIFGFICIATLNVSLIMSDVERVGKHYELNLVHELIQYTALILVNVTLLLPLVFEVDKAVVKDSKITLRTIFWTVKLTTTDLISFKSPPMLKFGILKTRRCFYLINRRDIRGYERLAQILMERIASGLILKA